MAHELGADRHPGRRRRRLARPHALGAAAPRSALLKHARRGLQVGAPRASLASLTVPALDRLFAYGTLMTGFSRRPLLGPTAILEAPGRVRGSLYDFGDYPGLVLDDAGWVAGELFRIPDLAARLPGLDREEGYDPADDTRSLYVRRRGSVRVDDGSSLDAWLYLYNDPGGPPGRGPRIPSGDWRAHLSGRGALSS